MKKWLICSFLCLLCGEAAAAEKSTFFWDRDRIRKRAEGAADPERRKVGHWTYWYPDGRKEKEGIYIADNENGRLTPPPR